MWLDRRRQQVRVFGKDDKHRDQLASKIQHLCQEAEIDTHAMPISRSDFERILLKGRHVLDQVIRGTQCRKVSLDIRNRSILVEGTPETAVQARAFLAKLLRASNGASEAVEELCPVCFCHPKTIRAKAQLRDCIAATCTVMIASKRGLPAAIFVTSHWFAFLKSAKLSYPSPTSRIVFVLKPLRDFCEQP